MIDRNSHSLLQTVTGGGALSNGEQESWVGLITLHLWHYCRDREIRCKLSTCYADLVFLLYARLISSHTHFTKTDCLDPIGTSPSCHIKQATFSLSSDVRERSCSAFNSSIVSCAVLYHHVDHRGQRSK